MTRNWILAGAALALLAFAGRLWQHADNVTPLFAVALFAGALFPRRFGFWVPLLALVASDLVIGLHDTVAFTWTGMFLFVWLGHTLRGRVHAGRIVCASLLGSTGFFLWSNFGVWLVSGMYSPTVAGLGQAYVMGLPFFRNSLLGDLGFTAALFAAWELVALRRAARLAPQNAH